MRPFPHIFAAGLPACGKSHVGRWLSDNHNYLHIDFENPQDFLLRQHSRELFLFIERLLPLPLINALKADGRPIFFDWGFPVTLTSIAGEISSVALPVWFHGDIDLARQSFSRRGGIQLAAFEKQVADISQHGFALDAIFGANTINAFRPDGSHKDPAEVFDAILEFRNEESEQAD